MIVIATIAAAASAPTYAAEAERGHPSFSQTGAPRTLSGAPGVYEWRFVARRGPSRFDRVGLHRVSAGPTPAPNPAIVVLYLPGTNMNGELAVDDPRNSLPLYLAAHGADVWSLDYRTHFIPPETPISQLDELRTWTNGLFEGDIDAAAQFVLRTTHRRKLFVAGFSRGAGFGYLYAAMHPKNVEGLAILDGFVQREPMTRAPKNVADDIGGRHLTYYKRKALMEAVIRNPDAAAPIPRYETARENLEHVVHDSRAFGGHGGLANPQGGFSDPVVLARVLINYDRYWPAVQDGENPFDPTLINNLKHSRIPVIAFSSTNISPAWPGLVAGSATLTGSGDVDFRRLEGWGHLDVICGTHAQSQVYAPLMAWLRRHRT